MKDLDDASHTFASTSVLCTRFYVIYLSQFVQLILQRVRFEDGVFNHALAVAQISANNVTLNSKSTQNVPIQ
jgi:hypothetical protein